MTTNRFIPKQELERIRKGSHEYFIHEVQDALQASTPRLFGESAEVELLATFPEKAVVLVDDERVMQLSMYRAGDGYLSLKDAKALQVESYDLKDASRYLDKRLEEAADAFIGGRRTAAETILREAAQVNFETPIQKKQLVESTVEAASATRPWKTILDEKLAEILNLIGEPKKDDIQIKFEQLLAKSSSDPDLSNYKELVFRDLGHLGRELTALSESVASDAATIRNAQGRRGVEEESILIKFSSFADDLSSDLSSLCNAVNENLNSTETFGQARVHDAIASEWHKYRTGAQFVEKLAEDLRAEGDD